MLDKTLDTLRACRDLSTARLNELKTKDAEKGILDKELNYYKDLTERLENRIKELEKIKCTEFNLIKIWIFKVGQFKKCS